MEQKLPKIDLKKWHEELKQAYPNATSFIIQITATQEKMNVSFEVKESYSTNLT